MESHRSLREENDVMALFSVFDPDNNGFTAGKCIKNSLSFLKDIPLAEINEILVKGQIADERKIFIEGTFKNSSTIHMFQIKLAV